MEDILFLILLFFIAFLYASIGHGGASGYLALMALFNIGTLYMKTSALTLNVFVAGIALFSFIRKGYFKWRIIIPFIVTSVPMAYVGARINTDPKFYKLILGIFLVFAALRILYRESPSFEKTRQVLLLPAFFIGAFLGFFSGMIGIGGGIVLSPVLILLRWANLRETAAASAMFILLNSASGLLGVYHSGLNYNQDIFKWVIIGFTGGLLGSYLGSTRFNNLFLKSILSGILFIASLKLFVF